MKILTSLFGLILFLAGIYLSYWVFMDFDSFETIMLGLYLGGSFILMTLGFFLFLLPLSFKSKNKKNSNSGDVISSDELNNQVFHEEVELTNNIFTNKIIHDEQIDEDIINIEEQIDENKVSVTQEIKLDAQSLDSNIESVKDITDELLFKTGDKDVEETVNITQLIKQNAQETISNTEPLKQDYTEELKFKTSDVYDVIELRVIGIDAWTSQNILKSLDESSILEISQKVKSGINMTQVTYKQRLIGYISRLDMNKVNDRLNSLVSVTPSNIIKDGRKIVHFSVNLKLKQGEIRE